MELLHTLTETVSKVASSDHGLNNLYIDLGAVSLSDNMPYDDFF